jgi:hypothetical protein
MGRGGACGTVETQVKRSTDERAAVRQSTLGPPRLAGPFIRAECFMPLRGTSEASVWDNGQPITRSLTLK